MAETITHNGKTYLKVMSTEKWTCNGCALIQPGTYCFVRVDDITSKLVCETGDDTNYILIENTPEARAEHFARKAANG